MAVESGSCLPRLHKGEGSQDAGKSADGREPAHVALGIAHAHNGSMLPLEDAQLINCHSHIRNPPPTFTPWNIIPADNKELYDPLRAHAGAQDI